MMCEKERDSRLGRFFLDFGRSLSIKRMIDKEFRFLQSSHLSTQPVEIYRLTNESCVFTQMLYIKYTPYTIIYTIIQIIPKII